MTRHTPPGLLGLMLLPLLAGCLEQPLSILEPAGPAAAPVARLWWVMLWGSLLIYGAVLVLAVYALRHRRRERPVPRRALLVGGGLVLPLTIVTLLLGYGIRSGQAMLPLPTSEPVYRVHVRAHQWWWEVVHPVAPDRTARAINELHVPAGQPFEVHVSSHDVIHSFWVPRLGGKIDAIPGRTNIIRLQAREPGEYHGLCAEFCGVGHARMPLVVHAHPAHVLETRLRELEPLVTDRVAGLPTP